MSTPTFGNMMLFTQPRYTLQSTWLALFFHDNQVAHAAHQEAYIHPVRVAVYQSAIVQEVIAAVQTNDVVVVGMRQPSQTGLQVTGCGPSEVHLSGIRQLREHVAERTALKLLVWLATFLMVFVRGTLVSGATDLQT
jgi:hypothetical protein